ncbi:MAG: hypothetical protein HY327_06375 [Chloroflexi bacterium]|nr:hypothetical protein [Chloroflexota bacterium]
MNSKRSFAIVALATLLTLFVGVSAYAAAPVGSNPSVAFDLVATATKWQDIEANTATWYMIEYHEGTQLDIGLDGYSVGGVTFEVYTPQQLNMDKTEVASKAIGLGTFNKSEPEHDMTWTGEFLDSQTLYVMVKNVKVWTLPYRLSFRELIPCPPSDCPSPIVPVEAAPAPIAPPAIIPPTTTIFFVRDD